MKLESLSKAHIFCKGTYSNARPIYILSLHPLSHVCKRTYIIIQAVNLLQIRMMQKKLKEFSGNAYHPPLYCTEEEFVLSNASSLFSFLDPNDIQFFWQ